MYACTNKLKYLLCECTVNDTAKSARVPVWTTCQKPVEYIKFPLKFPIMEAKKTLSSQTILEFGIPIVGNVMLSNF